MLEGSGDCPKEDGFKSGSILLRYGPISCGSEIVQLMDTEAVRSRGVGSMSRKLSNTWVLDVPIGGGNACDTKYMCTFYVSTQ
jgi:hypothetical protein